jgi:23S rRNA pseudouridine2605 synthase
MVRLQKFLAEAGVGSRRANEHLILAGQVAVNGQTVRELGTKVHPGQDRVEVDGQLIKPKRKLYLALHKPRGYLCTRKDPLERRTVAHLLPKEWSHVSTVGRLDNNSEGLIFLTNDGQFALRLTHPRYGVRKIYRVTVKGRVPPSVLGKFLVGVEEAGEVLKAEKVRLISANNTNSVAEIELAEGRNREVRRLFESQGYTIIRLLRIQIGRIKLGELPPGKWRTLTEPEIKSLLAPI